MNLLKKDNKYIEDTNELGRAVVLLIEENLNPRNWGFSQTFTNFTKRSSQIVIYDSKWCRIHFSFSRQRVPEHDELSIYYARLHAPNEEPFMIWEKEKCRCWHHFLDPLRFLDGLTPHEAVEQVNVLKQLPKVVKGFRESELGKKLLDEYPPKSAIVLQSVLWKHYGQRLFDLFDLRIPDLWQKYGDFLREYYKLLGEKSSYGPPYENVC